MGISARKITTLAHLIVSLADKPNTVYTAAQLKAYFDDSSEEIQAALNGLIDDLLAVTDSNSGADNIGATAVTDLDGATVQALIESVRNKLKSIVDGSSGADFIAATAISGLTGATVQALLEALKGYIDTHKTSSDHDGRYYTESEVGSTTDGTSGSDRTGLTAIGTFIATTVQSFLEELITRLQATTDDASGADLIAATGISGLTGATVQALLEALKSYVDTHKSSSDHDSHIAGIHYTKVNMQTSGQSELHWDNLTNKPNFADSSWKPAVATKAALPTTSNTVGDMRVVANDGDGKSAMYRCKATTGSVDDQWEKIADLDWTNDHGALVGLTDDDHPQYLRADGTRALSGNISFGGYQAQNMVVHTSASAPSTPQTGMLWYDSANSQLKVYKGAVIGWVDVSGQGATARKVEITATAGQTVFDVGQSNIYSYEVGTNSMNVYKKNLDGFYELVDKDDYTETDSKTVTLDTGATIGDQYLFIWYENSPAVINAAVQKDGTLQTNLNSDLLDGQHGSYYAADSELTKLKLRMYMGV